jgi:hypothetical protein
MCSVTVFGVEGETLAPCHPARARQLLKAKRAVVKSVQPYSIRLLSRSDGNGGNHTTPPFKFTLLSTPDSLANPFHSDAGNRNSNQTENREMLR